MGTTNYFSTFGSTPGGGQPSGRDWQRLPNAVRKSVQLTTALIDADNTSLNPSTLNLRSGLLVCLVSGVIVAASTSNSTGFVGILSEDVPIALNTQTYPIQAAIDIEGIIDKTKCPNYASDVWAAVTNSVVWQSRFQEF